MYEIKHTPPVPARGVGDAVASPRQAAVELDRALDDWPPLRWPSYGQFVSAGSLTRSPRVDVFERDNRLVTRVDLPGMKKEDMAVEVRDGHLELSGEREHEKEETKGNVYRSECEYGSFYRTVPLPEGVTPEDVTATLSDGVLEVSVPLPAKPAAAPSWVCDRELQTPAAATTDSVSPAGSADTP